MRLKTITVTGPTLLNVDAVNDLALTIASTLPTQHLCKNLSKEVLCLSSHGEAHGISGSIDEPLKRRTSKTC